MNNSFLELEDFEDFEDLFDYSPELKSPSIISIPIENENEFEKDSEIDYKSLYTNDNVSDINSILYTEIPLDDENSDILSYYEDNHEDLIDNYKILYQILINMENKEIPFNLKIKMKSLSDDLLNEIDKTPKNKLSINDYFDNSKNNIPIKPLHEISAKFSKSPTVLTPQEKELSDKAMKLLIQGTQEKQKTQKRRGAIFQPIQEKSIKQIPIKSLQEISEKFVKSPLVLTPEEKELSDKAKKLIVKDTQRRNAVYNISKTYYDKLKDLSEKYHNTRNNLSSEKEKKQLQKKFEKDSLEIVKLLRKNIILQFPEKESQFKMFKKRRNALSDIHKVFQDKIEELENERNKKINKEQDEKSKESIKEYYNNEINRIKDIQGFYKGFCN